MMFQELERVVLTTDIPLYGLQKGDIGTIVMVYQAGAGYEVEFMTLEGKTIGVVTLYGTQVRPIQRGEIAHVRMIEEAVVSI